MTGTAPMRTIGLIGGMSWESSALYYRLFNEAVRARLGGLHSARLVLWSVDFDEIAAQQSSGDWAACGRTLAQAAGALERAGADVILLATNTMHKVADAITAQLTVPFLHLADVTTRAVKGAGYATPLVLATRYTMEQRFYLERLEQGGLKPMVPASADRDAVHRVIYDELCRGVVSAASKALLLEIVSRAGAEGADSVILGCTELGMILAEGEGPLPVFDTTRLHVAAGVAYALNDEA